jgi:hypothetical protein
MEFTPEQQERNYCTFRWVIVMTAVGVGAAAAIAYSLGASDGLAYLLMFVVGALIQGTGTALMFTRSRREARRRRH